MPYGAVTIRKSITRGPYVVIFEIDGVLQDVQPSIATHSAAIDVAKTLLATVSGTVDMTRIGVKTV